MSAPRKIRPDKQVGILEKELGVQVFGSESRTLSKDKISGAVRKIPQGTLSDDQKIAAKIEIRPHPKSKASDLKRIQKAVRNLR